MQKQDGSTKACMLPDMSCHRQCLMTQPVWHVEETSCINAEFANWIVDSGGYICMPICAWIWQTWTQSSNIYQNLL